MVILPSDGGDHAGEIDLAVEHNPLSWFHLIHILTVIVLIEMMIMIMMEMEMKMETQFFKIVDAGRHNGVARLDCRAKEISDTGFAKDI